MTDFGRRVAAAAANVLPKTGQTISYADYDDGYYEKGWIDTDRFTDNEDGTVTDNATGLMWPIDFAGAGGNNGDYINWQGAIDFAEGLDFAGYQDWRLPNQQELTSLVDRGAYGPAIYSIFENVTWEVMWHSTTNPNTATEVLTLDVWAGTLYGFLKTFAYITVLPVRTV